MLAVMLALSILVRAEDDQLFECTRSKVLCEESVHWIDRDIRYRLRTSARATLDAGLLERSLERSMARWSGLACTDLSFHRTGRVERDEAEPCSGGCPDGFRCDAESQRCRGTEVVTLPPGMWGMDKLHDDRVLALTTVSFDTGTGIIRSAMLELNPDVAFVDATEGCAGAFDLDSVLTHETGHVIGLSHPCEFPGTERACSTVNCNDVLNRLATGQGCLGSTCDKDAVCVGGQCLKRALPTMWPSTDACDTSLRSLEVDDVTAVCLVYPRSAPPQYCGSFTDLGVGSKPFGCTTMGAEGGGGGAACLFLGLAAWVATSSRRRPRSGEAAR